MYRSLPLPGGRSRLVFLSTVAPQVRRRWRRLAAGRRNRDAKQPISDRVMPPTVGRQLRHRRSPEANGEANEASKFLMLCHVRP